MQAWITLGHSPIRRASRTLVLLALKSRKKSRHVSDVKKWSHNGSACAPHLQATAASLLRRPDPLHTYRPQQRPVYSAFPSGRMEGGEVCYVIVAHMLKIPPTLNKPVHRLYDFPWPYLYALKSQELNIRGSCN